MVRGDGWIGKEMRVQRAIPFATAPPPDVFSTFAVLRNIVVVQGLVRRSHSGDPVARFYVCLETRLVNWTKRSFMFVVSVLCVSLVMCLMCSFPCRFLLRPPRGAAVFFFQVSLVFGGAGANTPIFLREL